MTTIRDVARESGVSIATVSHVLNGRNDRVGEATRLRVLDVIRRLRYRPTAVDPGRSTVATKRIGVLSGDQTVSPLSNWYFADVLNGILEGAFLRGWSVSIYAERMWSNVGLAIRRTYDGHCDGIIYIAPRLDTESINVLHERGTPLLLVGSESVLEDVPVVDLDNSMAGIMAFQYLWNLGHRRIAVLTAREFTPAAGTRVKAFFDEASRHGVSQEEILVVSDHNLDYDEFVGHAILGTNDNAPTAFFCWHDPTALALMQALQRAGLRVPDDISVIGVNGRREGERFQSPPLTSIFQDPVSMGRLAVDLLIEALEKGQSPAEGKLFEPTLQERGTASPPKMRTSST